MPSIQPFIYVSQSMTKLRNYVIKFSTSSVLLTYLNGSCE